MIATKDALEPQSGEPMPSSSRSYVPGKLHPALRVPFREIALNPTRAFDGKVEANDPVRVYDCSGPWGDPAFKGTVEQGLPPLRRPWIMARGDVQEVEITYKPIPGHSDATIPPSLRRKALRAKPGQAVSQLHYARRGIITPEMEFIAIRENLGREQAPATLDTRHSAA
jgi:phosphomethylpyrimidine synthase